MRKRRRFITVVIGVENKASLIEPLQQYETLTNHSAWLHSRDYATGRVGKTCSCGISLPLLEQRQWLLW